jgi:hypothetical protein
MVEAGIVTRKTKMGEVRRGRRELFLRTNRLGRNCFQGFLEGTMRGLNSIVEGKRYPRIFTNKGIRGVRITDRGSGEVKGFTLSEFGGAMAEKAPLLCATAWCKRASPDFKNRNGGSAAVPASGDVDSDFVKGK